MGGLQLQFTDRNYERAYLLFLGQQHVPILQWRLGLSFAASVLAMGQFAAQMMTAEATSLRWRAPIAATPCAALAMLCGCAVLTKRDSRRSLAARNERVAVTVELITLLATLWWLLLSRTCERAPQHGALTALLPRAYVLAAAQLRLAAALPLMVLHATVLVVVELLQGAGAAAVCSMLLRLLLLSQLPAASLTLAEELRLRGQFVQHCPTERRAQGPWADAIEAAALTANAARQLVAQCVLAVRANANTLAAVAVAVGAVVAGVTHMTTRHDKVTHMT